ncbi:MAG: histidine phosphatase family protein [Propioniciclava sp.]|uniref:histidine phosphatase family protein n=1 Tax=Propioniciclava sp. TaxID=2038686 RepID=UPI0039E6B441
MRVTLIAHGPTEGTRRGTFGDATDLLVRAPIPLRHGKALLVAPEPACLRTASLLRAGGEAMAPEVIDGLRGPAMGEWTGLALEDALARDPAGVQAWLQDPAIPPPDGESLADHLARIGAVLDSHPWPESGAVVVATPFTVRAACAHALDAGPRALRHLDIAPGTHARITRHAGMWRLAAVTPPRYCSTPDAREDA